MFLIALSLQILWSEIFLRIVESTCVHDLHLFPWTLSNYDVKCLFFNVTIPTVFNQRLKILKLISRVIKLGQSVKKEKKHLTKSDSYYSSLSKDQKQQIKDEKKICFRRRRYNWWSSINDVTALGWGMGLLFVTKVDQPLYWKPSRRGEGEILSKTVTSLWMKPLMATRKLSISKQHLNLIRKVLPLRKHKNDNNIFGMITKHSHNDNKLSKWKQTFRTTKFSEAVFLNHQVTDRYRSMAD